jgi:sortase A
MGAGNVDRDPVQSAEPVVRRSYVPPTVTGRSGTDGSPTSNANGNMSGSTTSGSSRTGKTSYWDRPKPPRDWHWFLGRLGSILIIAGLLVFMFVGYQLWGTGIEAAQSQQRLENEFADRASFTGEIENAPTRPPEPATIANGDPMALIEIPAIGVSKYVVAGVETSDLKKGPGHYPSTPFPGELGNAAIAGHRTTYGEPFRQLDELVVGDPIIVTDLLGRRFTYLVTGQQIVTPQDSWVVDTVDPTVASLTLTTCHPEFSAKQRLIVFAELDPASSDVTSYPAATYQVDTTAPEQTTTEPPVDDQLGDDSGQTVDEGSDATEAPLESSTDDVFDKGWFSDPSALPHVAAWILLDILIVIIAWQIAKRVRNRAIGLAIGIVPFFVVLYFVFQNVNRLLPPNL